MLRDGVLQQVDTPQNLFRQPANLFVAAFIGSPSMNLVDADLADGQVSFAGYSFALDESSPLRGRDGRVILGIRPTDFVHGESAQPHLPLMAVQPEVVEDLGSQIDVIFTIDAPRVSAEAVRAATETTDDDGILFADERASFTACLDLRRAASPGARLELAVDCDRFHFFDPATGHALGGGVRSPLAA